MFVHRMMPDMQENMNIVKAKESCTVFKTNSNTTYIYIYIHVGLARVVVTDSVSIHTGDSK